MRTGYMISWVLCLLQLLIWLFMPFVGVMGIVDMILEKGFYVNAVSHSRDYTMADIFGLTESNFGVMNRIIALLYFYTSCH